MIRIAEKISLNYKDLSAFMDTKQIPVRASKVESRVKVDNPVVKEIIPQEYKSLNEVLLPKEIPEEIRLILQKKENTIIPKQWKTKQLSLIHI